jgi:hypothetical protein
MKKLLPLLPKEKPEKEDEFIPARFAGSLLLQNHISVLNAEGSLFYKELKIRGLSGQPKNF